MKQTAIFLLAAVLCLSAFSGCTVAECVHEWEKAPNYNNATAVDQCVRCTETRMYTDPDCFTEDVTTEEAASEESTHEETEAVCDILIAYTYQPSSCYLPAKYEEAVRRLVTQESGWRNEVTECACDYEITIDGILYHYHSSCRSISVRTQFRSTFLTESEGNELKTILDSLFKVG